MKLRALIAALLVSPAWAQEMPTFDIKSESVKNIVRATAAAQSRTVRIVEEKAPKDPAKIRFVPAEKVAPVERPAPRLPPEPRGDTFLSAFIDSLVEHELDRLLEEPVTVTTRCASRPCAGSH